MKNIESVYEKYTEIIDLFTMDIITSRFGDFRERINAFIESNHYKENLKVNDTVLMCAIMDYFSDISRLKDFHGISTVNEIKIHAYSAYWFLKRKPIQIIPNLNTEFLIDDAIVYCNEKFVLSYLIHFLLGNNINVPILNEANLAFNNFLNSLLYYFKFRDFTAQSIEIFILAFKSGNLIMFDEK